MTKAPWGGAPLAKEKIARTQGAFMSYLRLHHTARPGPCVQSTGRGAGRIRTMTALWVRPAHSADRMSAKVPDEW